MNTKKKKKKIGEEKHKEKEPHDMIYGTSHLEATRDEIQGVIRLRAAAAEALFVCAL